MKETQGPQPQPLDADAQKKRDEWLEQRRTGLGASDAAAVLGIDPWRSPLELYQQKVAPAPDDEGEEWKRLGTAFEKVIGQLYSQRTGRRVRLHPRRITHDTLPFMFAHLDFIVYDPTRPKGQEKGALEVKMPGGIREADWQDGPPPYYQAQVQHQMAVTGYTWASFAVLIGGRSWSLLTPWEKPELDVEMDPEFVAHLMAKETEFMGYVSRREMPPLSSIEADERALRLLFSEPNDNREAVIDLPEKSLFDHALFEQGSALEKLGKRMKGLAKNRLLTEVADNHAGVLPNHKKAWRRKSVTRKGYTVEPSTAIDFRSVKWRQ